MPSFAIRWTRVTRLNTGQFLHSTEAGAHKPRETSTRNHPEGAPELQPTHCHGVQAAPQAGDAAEGPGWHGNSGHWLRPLRVLGPREARAPREDWARPVLPRSPASRSRLELSNKTSSWEMTNMKASTLSWRGSEQALPHTAGRVQWWAPWGHLGAGSQP